VTGKIVIVAQRFADYIKFGSICFKDFGDEYAVRASYLYVGASIWPSVIP
jgi:hypothetical protein